MQEKATRLSKNKPKVGIYERSELRDNIVRKLMFNQITLGQALKTLRINLLAIKQKQYADFVKVSTKTLSDLENDKGNYSVEIINQVLRPFELKVGVLPTRAEVLEEIILNYRKE